MRASQADPVILYRSFPGDRRSSWRSRLLFQNHPGQIWRTLHGLIQVISAYFVSRHYSNSTSLSQWKKLPWAWIAIRTSKKWRIFQNVHLHICIQFFTRQTISPVERALNDAKMDKGTVHDVVLVGGSTRIPKVQKMLQVCIHFILLDIFEDFGAGAINRVAEDERWDLFLSAFCRSPLYYLKKSTMKTWETKFGALTKWIL